MWGILEHVNDKFDKTNDSVSLTNDFFKTVSEGIVKRHTIQLKPTVKKKKKKPGKCEYQLDIRNYC